MNLNLNISFSQIQFWISNIKASIRVLVYVYPFSLYGSYNHIKFIPFLTEYSIDKLLLSQWYYAHNEILEKQENE